MPTSAELGYPGILSSSWTGLAVPVNTPDAIVARLAKATDQVFASEDYQKIINKNGFELFGFNDEQTAAFIKAEVEKWAESPRPRTSASTSACPGKVDTGFPKRTCANANSPLQLHTGTRNDE